MRTLSLAVLLLALPVAAVAAPKASTLKPQPAPAVEAPRPPKASGPQCPVSLPQDQLTACYEKAADDTVKRLDELLSELRHSLGRRGWSSLKQSQVLWEKSRELDCSIEASFIDDPAIRPAVRAGCTEQRTRERMHALRFFLCPRYDLTGRCDEAQDWE